MVRTLKKTLKSSSKFTKSMMDQCDEAPLKQKQKNVAHPPAKQQLPTILSAADLQASDLGFPTTRFQTDEEPERKWSFDESEDSTAYASSCVSDDDSLCSDVESNSASPLSKQQATTQPVQPSSPVHPHNPGSDEAMDASKEENASKLDVDLTCVARARGVSLFRNDPVIKAHQIVLRTIAYVSTMLCMMSPCATGMAVARIVERVPLLPVLLNLCFIAKRSNSRMKLPRSPYWEYITCGLSMILPIPVGMTVARCVQYQPLAAVMTSLWIMCITKGKHNAVDFVRKILRFSAYSLVVPSLIAPLSVGALLANLQHLLGLQQPKTLVSTAIVTGAVLYLMPESKEEVDDEA